MNELEGLATRGTKGAKGSKSLLTRATGRFYTHELICYQLIETVLHLLPKNRRVFRVVEPFSGDGRLVVELMRQASTHLRSREWIVELWDSDADTLIQARNLVERASIENKIEAVITAKKVDSFAEAEKRFGRFDLCVTNPPWEVLKPDRRELKLLTLEDGDRYTQLLRERAAHLEAAYPTSIPKRKFSGWGMNLARCGVEAAIRLLDKNGIFGIVSPASLMADQMSETLRAWLFENNNVRSVTHYAAEARLFESVDQPCITLCGIRSGRTDSAPELHVVDRRCERKSENIDDNIWTATSKGGYVLPVQWGRVAAMRVLQNLQDLKSFADLESDGTIWAGRELDETDHESYLGNSGLYLFVKGRMVQRFEMTETPVDHVRVDGPKVPKSAEKWRIAWRDVARPNQKRRVQATLVQPGYVTGNSLSVAFCHKEDIVFLRALLGIMNSFVFEAQARTHLATAHVSLGAVRQVKIPRLPSPDVIFELSKLVERRMGGDGSAEIELEVAVAKLYGFTRETFAELLTCFEKVEPVECQSLLADRLWETKTPKAKSHSRRPLLADTNAVIPNHYAASLSMLDMDIVVSVPPGGNWKNIPVNIPSARLETIRTSFAAGEGSRSTYYGRLRSDAPAYTINTYFTRPGNGCHIHYDFAGGQHRTMSHREAARFQSFPDGFIFLGSKSSVAQQIGNAVPPLLAYQVAKSLGKPGVFVDLFSGAGGLALGFQWAGWKSLVANDIDRDFLATYAHNIDPKIVCGDIRDDEVFNSICLRAQAGRLASLPLFVLGGPPCQGFSTAGKRRSMGDDRNWLFKKYKELLHLLEPDGFLFENVTGLLNMEGGRVFELIKKELKEEVPTLHAWKLQAEEFGIPQRRTRLFLVGDRRGVVKGPPQKCTQFGKEVPLFASLSKVISAEEAIGDLPPLSEGEDGSMKEYRFSSQNPYQQFMRGERTAEDYLKELKTGQSSKPPDSSISAIALR